MSTLQERIGVVPIERRTLKYPELNNYSEILNLEGEFWKDIVNFEGFYRISNLGRVKRLAQQQVKPRRKQELILKATNDTAGYPQVILGYNKKRVARVHRLVAEHFLQPPSEELISACLVGRCKYVLVNHIDGDTTNPNILNLEWCSPSRNSLHGKSNLANPKMTGSACYTSVLKEQDVLKIIELLEQGTLSQEKIGEMFGVKQITISNLWCGRSWSHLTGIKWKARSRKQRVKSCVMAEQNILQL